MTYRVGLVGLGKIAQDQHVPVIAADPDFELATVISTRGATEPGVPVFRTLSEFLAAGVPIDALSICTPPDVRHAMARQALEAGLPVLLEKPPAMTLSELADLTALAIERRVPLFATWHSRFNPAVDAARDRLKGRRLKRLDVQWREDVRRWHPGQEWIWQAGGYGVFDPGINALSIVTRIAPEPLSVTAAELEIPANRDTPIAARLSFRSLIAGPDAELSATFDWRQQGEQTWTIELETQDGEVLTLTGGGVRLAVDGTVALHQPAQEYEHIYRRWAELLATGGSDVDPAPLRLVADAFLNGRRRETAPFIW